MVKAIRNPKLCGDCQPWNDIRSVVSSFPRRDGHTTELKAASANLYCVLCQAIAHAVRTRLSGPDLHDHAQDNATIKVKGPCFFDTGIWPPDSHEKYISNRIDYTNPSEMVVRLLIRLHIHGWDKEKTVGNSWLSDDFSMTPQLLIRYSARDVPQLVSVEPWEVRFFDVSLVREWLHDCSGRHGTRCMVHMTQDMPRGFREIDVKAMKVVEPPKEAPFVALSYMWPQEDTNNVQLEKKTLAVLSAHRGLEGFAIPDLPLDSIWLCRELGEQYLWVDRFCILQDDARSKHDQISAMDKIYGAASFCIVAALNDRLGNGLPGCPNRPRKGSVWAPPRVAEPERRGIRDDSINRIVDASLWNTRGWTFQELVLSSRRVFITDFSVAFECKEERQYEEFAYYSRPPGSRDIISGDFHKITPFPGPTSESEGEPDFQYSPQASSLDLPVDMSTPDNLVAYLRLVEDYTSRQLSFGSDILKAFEGVGNVTCETLGSHSMIFGLPERWLARALLWGPIGDTKPRLEVPEIPSWSWASLSNKANYRVNKYDSRVSPLASIVRFWYQDPVQGLRKLKVEETWMGQPLTIDQFDRLVMTPELAGMEAVPTVLLSTKTWRASPHNPWEVLGRQTLDPSARNAASRLSGALLFNTTVVSSVKSEASDSRGNGRDDIVLIGDFDGCTLSTSRDRCIGRLSRDFDIIPEGGQDKSYDLIAICGGIEPLKTRQGYVDIYYNYDSWILWVLMVERLSSYPYVARRVDAGWVSLCKWRGLNPRWETVVLC